jgi:hypothetical protein
LAGARHEAGVGSCQGTSGAKQVVQIRHITSQKSVRFHNNSAP